MHDDMADAWPDPGGPEPDDAAWLTPQTGWTWDADSLMMGEYVGYPLYLRLRDRLQSLRLPTTTHNQLIQTMIDTHDVSVFDHGEARSTLIVKMRSNDIYNVHDIEIHDASEFATLSSMM
jgi:hypothetical protein